MFSYFDIIKAYLRFLDLFIWTFSKLVIETDGIGYRSCTGIIISSFKVSNKMHLSVSVLNIAEHANAFWFRFRTNCRPYYPVMPHTSGTHRNLWSDSFGWRHTMLAKSNHSQHLICGYPSKRRRRRRTCRTNIKTEITEPHWRPCV